MMATRVQPLPHGEESQARLGLLAAVNGHRDSHVRDLSKRTRAELLAVARDEVAAAARQRNEFLAVLLHELRNSLAPIVNALRILRLTHEPDSLVQTNARTLIERQVGLLTHLVNDLQEISGTDAGRMRFQPVHMDLRDVIPRSVEAVMTAFAHRRHEVSIALPPEPIWLDADPIRLEQVVVNLVSNAAKYTHDGGRIDVVARRERDRAELLVSDNGSGIAPELLPRVFDLFVRAETGGVQSRGSWGVGLNVVKRIVDLHGGTVVAKSGGPGAGSEFVVSLPLVVSGS